MKIALENNKDIKPQTTAKKVEQKFASVTNPSPRQFQCTKCNYTVTADFHLQICPKCKAIMTVLR